MIKMKVSGIFPRSIAFAAILTGILLFTCGDLFVWNGDPDPPVNVLTAKDSLAVRAILDANGLYDKEVREVIDLQNSMVVSMSLDSIMQKSIILPKELDSLNNGFGIKITDSQIETLTINDTIHTNLTISIYRTRLKNISDDFSLLKGTLNLYLPNNKIANISPEIMKCTVRYIDLQYNFICLVSDSLNNWIIKNSRNQNWQSTQQCDLSMY